LRALNQLREDFRVGDALLPAVFGDQRARSLVFGWFDVAEVHLVRPNLTLSLCAPGGVLRATGGFEFGKVTHW
jgi:hypothetical protein